MNERKNCALGTGNIHCERTKKSRKCWSIFLVLMLGVIFLIMNSKYGENGELIEKVVYKIISHVASEEFMDMSMRR